MTGVKVMVIGPGIKTGLSIQIDNPAQLGSDLVADAVRRNQRVSPSADNHRHGDCNHIFRNR